MELLNRRAIPFFHIFVGNSAHTESLFPFPPFCSSFFAYIFPFLCFFFLFSAKYFAQRMCGSVSFPFFPLVFIIIHLPCLFPSFLFFFLLPFAAVFSSLSLRGTSLFFGFSWLVGRPNVPPLGFRPGSFYLP